MTKRLITLDMSGAVVCPWHGALDLAQDLIPGRLACGCEAVEGAHGRLFVVKSDCAATFAASIENAATCETGDEKATRHAV